jgi:small subunit ribosomal protein S16
MAVSIRLSRQGAKKNPSYLIVAASDQGKRDGAYLERLGQYFPKAEKAEAKIKVNLEALKAWQAKGARVTQTVGQLLKTIAK